jgi:general secretion pathway protein K
LTTDSRGSGRINPLAASQEVLLLLAGGDQGLAKQVAANRDAGVAGMDTTRLQTAFTDSSTSSRLRFRAFVPSLDGPVAIVRDIDISPVAEGTAPWRTLRAHAPVLSPK